MISLAMQRYLAEIYRLQQDSAAVPLSALSEQADASLQATSRMLRRLKAAGLIMHTPYQGVRLTPAGERIALLGVRRHRLMEVFLVRVMGFGWEEVHELADDLEAGVGPQLEDRIDEMTGHPQRCPHGEPIPSREGVLPPLHDVSLVTIAPGSHAHISRVRTHDPARLRYLAELQLMPGAPLQLLSYAPFRGPLRVRSRGQEHFLGYELAADLWVELA